MIHRHVHCVSYSFLKSVLSLLMVRLMLDKTNIYLEEGVHFVLLPSKHISSIPSTAIFLGFQIVPSDRSALLKEPTESCCIVSDFTAHGPTSLAHTSNITSFIKSDSQKC